jgi:hypothetical protein
VTPENRAKLAATIDGLRAGSCTNLSGGLFEGMKAMSEKREGARPVRSILLMTDGLANEGIREGPAIVTAMRSMMGERPDYTVYTFGYGLDHNADMLKAISEGGNGMYYFIENNDLIATSFADCLGGLLSVVGQNLSLKLSPVADGYTIKRICTKKAHTVASGGTEASLSLGDIQSEEERDVLFEVQLPMVVNRHDEPRPVFVAELTYVNLLSKSFETAVAEARIARPEVVPEAQERNPSVVDALDRFKATEAMAEAHQLAQQGQMREARAVLGHMKGFLAARPGGLAPGGLTANLCADMDEMDVHMGSTSEYAARGAKAASSAMQSHVAQRSNRVWAGDEDRGAYKTAKKVQMRSKAASAMAVPPQAAAAAAFPSPPAPPQQQQEPNA